MERILKCVVDGISLDTKSLAKLAESLEANGDTRRVASDPKDVEGLAVVDEACTMDPVGDTTTRSYFYQSLFLFSIWFLLIWADFSGEFSYWNFSMRIKHHIDSQMEQVRGQDSDCFDNYARARELRVGHNHLSAAIECLPPRQVAHFLARTFLNYAETYYFFVEKTWLFEQIDSLYDGARTLTKKGGEVIISIILTVLAIGTQYAHLESSGHGSPSTAGQTFSEENVGATFYQQAIRLLPEIIELSSLESVQACLLFGYYALPIDASGLGYIYINLAIRLGMQNGIHRKCKNGAFDPAMVKLRNHVWWTAYSLERFGDYKTHTLFRQLLIEPKENIHIPWQTPLRTSVRR